MSLLPRGVFQVLDFQPVAKRGVEVARGCEGLVKPEGDVPGSVSFTGTLPSGVRGSPSNYHRGAKGLSSQRVMCPGA